jgi:hypothetical protein
MWVVASLPLALLAGRFLRRADEIARDADDAGRRRAA